MTSNARKEKRQLWWKQHGKQLDDVKDDAEKPKIFKKSYHKGSTVNKKEQKEEQQTTSIEKPIKTEESNNKKTRFIVFIGNLPFDLQKEDVIHHFRCTGGVTDFRLMTKKDSGTSKGCGFLELDNFVSYEKALNLHHSFVGGRKINVEVTCGGGGSGEKRAEKLNDKKKKFRQRRGKKKSVDDTDNKDKNNSTADGKQNDSTIKKEKIKTEPVQAEEQTQIAENKDKSSEVKCDTSKINKRKIKDEPGFDSGCDQVKKKKKSLKQSNAMNSMVKDLELETMVQLKQEKNAQDTKEKKKKKKKLKPTEKTMSK